MGAKVRRMDNWKQLLRCHCSIFEDMPALKKCLPYVSFLILFFVSTGIRGQTKILSGVILDIQSGERVPFASMRLVRRGSGKLSDSAGGFSFRFEQWPRDTLEVSYVGFQTYYLALSDSLFSRSKGDSLFVVVSLQRGNYINEVVVSRKVDFGLLLWRKIVKHKESNDRYRFHNFSYELYNKLELDRIEINRDRMENVKLLKPFGFILNNIDSSEANPFLPNSYRLRSMRSGGSTRVGRRGWSMAARGGLGTAPSCRTCGTPSCPRSPRRAHPVAAACGPQATAASPPMPHAPRPPRCPPQGCAGRQGPLQTRSAPQHLPGGPSPSARSGPAPAAGRPPTWRWIRADPCRPPAASPQATAYCAIRYSPCGVPPPGANPGCLVLEIRWRYPVFLLLAISSAPTPRICTRPTDCPWLATAAVLTSPAACRSWRTAGCG